MKRKILGKRLVILILLLGLSSARAFADMQNFTLIVPDNSMKNHDASVLGKGTGFVQFIKGAPGNPPTGVANATRPAMSGSDAYAVCSDPNNAALLGASIKGLAGDYSGQGAGDGGFALKNMLNHSLNTNYYIRYWTTDTSKNGGATYYGNSDAQCIWTTGSPVPGTFTFSNFTVYKAAAPYPPSISSIYQKSAVEKSLTPNTPQVKKSDVAITFGDGTTQTGDAPVQVGGSSNHSAYELRIKRGSDFSGSSDTGDKQVTTLTSPSYDIDLASTDTASIGYWIMSQSGATYYVRGVAYNYFGNTAGPSQSFVLVDLGGGTGVGGGTSATFSLVAGINTLSMPCDPTKAVTVQVGSNPGAVVNASGALTLGQLIKAINTQAGSNVVSVVGLFDAAKQQHVGVSNIQYTSAKDIDTTKGTPIGNLTADTKYTVAQILGPTPSVGLSKGQALQLTVASPITVVISGQ